MSQGAEEAVLVQESVKDKKQLKKEKKERERQQKEKEKQEKARRKQEEKEKKRQKKANDKEASKEITEASDKSSKQAVSVVEPPSQITSFGQPIKVVFSTENAGQGPLSASCKGTKIGDVVTEVMEQSETLCSVQFIPNEADVYTLTVQWGGVEVAGSPFQVNLTRLSPSSNEVREAVKQGDGDELKGQEKMQENTFSSDDPFSMAYNASRLLEEQHRQAQMIVPHPDSAVAAQSPGSPQFSYNQQYQAPPPSNQVPEVVTEELQHLKESNESLKKTNESMGEEISELRLKMTDFESKLSTLEEASQKTEEERKLLMANLNVQGWLYKRGLRGLLANVWRRRYFRCNQGSKIYYYKSVEEGIPQGYIDLDKVSSVEKVEATEENQRVTFTVTCEDRTFQLQAENEATMQEWISAITYLKDWRQKNRGTFLGAQPQ